MCSSDLIVCGKSRSCSKNFRKAPGRLTLNALSVLNAPNTLNAPNVPNALNAANLPNVDAVKRRNAAPPFAFFAARPFADK